MAPPKCSQFQVRPLLIFSRRNFYRSSRSEASNFFDLGARAASRENYHISKQSGIPHIESSPSPQLLRAERDLAENRKERNARIAGEEGEAGIDAQSDPYAMYIGKQPVPTYAAESPSAPAVDPHARDEQVMHLRRTIEQYKKRIVRLEEEFAERTENAYRRENIWKYVGPIALAVGFLGVVEGYKWRRRFLAVDHELDEARAEMGAVKRERDHLSKAWYEKLNSESMAGVPQRTERLESRAQTVGWTPGNLLWK